MPFVTVENGVDIFYDLIGNGPFKVLMIMGLGTTHRSWLPNVIEISKNYEDYQFCVYDNRGVGQSSTPSGRYSTSQMANDGIKLIDHLGEHWVKPNIVGISMGGMIAQELTLAMIEMGRSVASLSLAVTHAGRSSASYPPLKGVMSLGKSLFCKTPEDRAAVLMDSLYSQEFLISQNSDGKSMREVVTEAYLERVKADPPTRLFGFLGHVSAITTHDVSSERLKTIKESGVPVCIMTGTKDDLVDHSNSLFLNDVLSPQEFIVWEGVGHCCNIEKFVEFNEALVRNFKRSQNKL